MPALDLCKARLLSSSMARYGAAALLAAAMTPSAYAQPFPARPIRMVASSVGSGTELATRLVAPVLSSEFGQPIVIENRPGGILQGEIVMRAQPDGHTLLSAGSSFALGPLLTKTPYDPIRDFSPVSVLGRYPNVLVVHPSVAATSVKELIALARSRPGALNYASGPTGASNHLAAEMFKSMAGVNIVRVAYKGGGPALNDLLAGQVQVLFASSGSVTPHLKSGRVRALAVTSAQPSQLLPGLPTVASSGVPGYESESIGFVLAPPKTPAAIIKRVNQAIVRVVGMPELKERLLNMGVEPVASTPQTLAAEMKADVARVLKLIKDAGIQAD